MDFDGTFSNGQRWACYLALADGAARVLLRPCHRPVSLRMPLLPVAQSLQAEADARGWRARRTRAEKIASRARPFYPDCGRACGSRTANDAQERPILYLTSG